MATVFDLFLHTDAAYAGIGPRVHSKEGGINTQQVTIIRLAYKYKSDLLLSH